MSSESLGVDHYSYNTDNLSSSIITVPVPGADPLTTWTRDALPKGIFDDLGSKTRRAARTFIGEQILHATPVRPALEKVPEKDRPSWVLRGIKREAPQARILTYTHGDLPIGTTLNSLAINLLKNIKKENPANVSQISTRRLVMNGIYFKLDDLI